MSTPAAKQSTFTTSLATETNVSKRVKENTEKKKPSDCPVSVSIEWSDRTKVNVLKPELSSLGKMLCRGTTKHIAKAAWNCAIIKSHLYIEVAKEIHKECILMCAKGSNKNNKKRSDSILRKTDKENIVSFSFDDLCSELNERASLLTLVLKTTSLRKLNKEEKWKQSVGVAAAVCLCNRSRNMTAMQLLISIIIRHSGFVVSTFMSQFISSISKNKCTFC